MSEYKGIKGFQVQTRSTDPVPFAQEIANNPYAGVWGSGGDLNTAGQGRSSAGTQTSNIVYGGAASPYTAVEEYDGTSWTETTEINTGKIYAFGFGANAESALMSGGYTNPSGPMFTNTETWNGSSWTEVNEMNAARGDGGSFGVVPGGIAAGGYSTPPTTTHDDVESWDGTSWSDSAAELNQARYYGSGVGYTSTAGLIIGGKEPSLSDKVESWNGSSWTEIAEINTARERVGGSGSSTAGLIYGGGPSISALTEDWNGTVWTEVNDMATARYGLASSPSGSSTLALASGGYTTTNSAATEEWAFSGLQPTDPSAGYADAIIGDFYYNSTTGQFKNISAGSDSWASGGNMNTGRGSLAPAVSGTQTAALAFGGFTSGPLPNAIRAETEKYDGTSWTEVGDLNTAKYQLSGAGIQTAALKFGGGPVTAATESWDNSSWTEVNDLNTARYGLTGLGLYNAALAVGGNPGPAQLAITESWDGTNWTEVNDLNTVRGEHFMAGGTQTSGIIAFGQINPGGPSTKTSKTELWDGTSWTEVNDGNTARSNLAGCGTQTDGLAFAGLVPPATAATEKWNGTTWTETSDLSTARDAIGGAGTRGSGIAFGGNTSPKQQTEEFTSTDFAIKTVTTS